MDIFFCVVGLAAVAFCFVAGLISAVVVADRYFMGIDDENDQ